MVIRLVGQNPAAYEEHLLFIAHIFTQTHCSAPMAIVDKSTLILTWSGVSAQGTASVRQTKFHTIAGQVLRRECSLVQVLVSYTYGLLLGQSSQSLSGFQY